MSLDEERERLLHQLRRLGVSAPASHMSEQTEVRLRIFERLLQDSQSGTRITEDIMDKYIQRACKITDQLIKTTVLMDDEGTVYAEYHPTKCSHPGPSHTMDYLDNGDEMGCCAGCRTAMIKKAGTDKWELWEEE